MKIFSDHLRRARGKKSQAEFADFLGLNQPNYQRYESGQQLPGLEIAAKIAERLGVSLDEMAGIKTATVSFFPTEIRHSEMRGEPSAYGVDWRARAEKSENLLRQLREELRSALKKIEDGLEVKTNSTLTAEEVGNELVRCMKEKYFPKHPPK